jgi:DNA-binding MarR family transcriptional regulator
MSIEEQLEPIKVIEKQSGLSRLLIFLYLEGSSNIGYMMDVTNIHHNQAYAAVRKAVDLKLITSTYGEESNYRVRKLALTEKGRKVAMHLSDVNEILSG